MKLSKETLAILKNFSTINQSILIESGNNLKTVSVNKTMMSNAVIEETFPEEFGLYDLHPSYLRVHCLMMRNWSSVLNLSLLATAAPQVLNISIPTSL